MKTLGQVVVLFLLGIPQTVFTGFILSEYWGWFIVPRFGVSSLTIGGSIGVMLTVGLLSLPIILAMPWKDAKDDDGWFMRKVTLAIGMLVFVLPLGLLSGYLWHLALR
jgi:hypothetical protein